MAKRIAGYLDHVLTMKHIKAINGIPKYVAKKKEIIMWYAKIVTEMAGTEAMWK